MITSKTKRYLLVSECETTGYVIGFFDNLKEAQKMMKKVGAKHDEHWGGDNFQTIEKAMNYPSYKIHPLINELWIEHCPRGETDGVHFLHIFDTNLVDNFSLDKFLFERANTIHLIPVADYAKRKGKNWAIDLNFLMAN